MRLHALREQVLDANLELVRRGLVLYTFGNASGIDRKRGLVAIKPSGVPYDRMTPGRHRDRQSRGRDGGGNPAPFLGSGHSL